MIGIMIIVSRKETMTHVNYGKCQRYNITIAGVYDDDCSNTSGARYHLVET